MTSATSLRPAAMRLLLAATLALPVTLGPGCDGDVTGDGPNDGGVRPRDTGPSAPPGEPTYDLADAPAELEIRWPSPPTITREVTASTLADVDAAMTSGTRIRVTAMLSGTVAIRQSDVEVVFDPGAGARSVWIANRLARVAVRGGTLGHVEMQVPGQYYPTEEFHPDWMTTDVLVDRVTVDATDTAFLMRGGVRIAITNSTAHAVRYGVWFGDTIGFESEDVIVAGNVIDCDGPEATVRLVHVRRSATVGNRLSNGNKHNYRIHGRSELNWGARNLLIDTGVFLGRIPGDSVGRQWFEDNTLHHTAPSLLEVDTSIGQVSLRGNTVHTNVWDCFFCSGSAPSGWTVEGNTVGPYVAPPSL